MTITNNNIPGIDAPVWEQLTNAPATSAAGTCSVDDNKRFWYHLFSATSFWRFDTWSHTWQQLASPPGGTLAAGSCMRYVSGIGSQANGVVYGSIMALIASGSAVVFYRWDEATNTWSSALSVANVPAAWGTDGRLVYPEPACNGWQGGYHSNVALNTITTTALAAAGATTISVSALPLALPANSVLNFGTASAPVWAVTTAAAAAAATSITVSPLIASVASGLSAYWYADMFLWGNNATVGYRYNVATNAWLLTSANSGNPTIAAVTAAPGAGMIACWLPGAYDAALNPNALNNILIVRGGATTPIYEYNLATNAVSTVTYYPATETWGAGTASAIQVDSNGKNTKLILQKDTSHRFYRLDRKLGTNTPLATLFQLTAGTAVVGDRATMIKIQGIDMLYFIPSTSTFVVRTALFF